MPNSYYTISSKWRSLPWSTFSPLFPNECCVLLASDICFLSAEIFGEQFLRDGRVVIIGCTCNNFSNDIKRLVSVMAVVVVIVVVVIAGVVVYDTLPLLWSLSSTSLLSSLSLSSLLSSLSPSWKRMSSSISEVTKLCFKWILSRSKISPFAIMSQWLITVQQLDWSQYWEHLSAILTISTLTIKPTTELILTRAVTNYFVV